MYKYYVVAHKKGEHSKHDSPGGQYGYVDLGKRYHVYFCRNLSELIDAMKVARAGEYQDAKVHTAGKRPVLHKLAKLAGIKLHVGEPFPELGNRLRPGCYIESDDGRLIVGAIKKKNSALFATLKR